jgi:hypothetical protein
MSSQRVCRWRFAGRERLSGAVAEDFSEAMSRSTHCEFSNCSPVSEPQWPKAKWLRRGGGTQAWAGVGGYATFAGTLFADEKIEKTTLSGDMVFNIIGFSQFNKRLVLTEDLGYKKGMHTRMCILFLHFGKWGVGIENWSDV